MTKYFKLLMVALFASMTLGFTACSDDDDVERPIKPELAATGFDCNGQKQYYRTSALLSYVQDDEENMDFEKDLMQLTFSLYRNPQNVQDNEEIDVYPQESVRLQVVPFDVETMAKGKTITVIKSEYTWAQAIGLNANGVPDTEFYRYYFKPEGKVTFEGYDKEKKVATVSVNLTMSSTMGSVSLNGTLQCAYNGKATSLAKYKGTPAYEE